MKVCLFCVAICIQGMNLVGCDGSDSQYEESTATFSRDLEVGYRELRPGESRIISVPCPHNSDVLFLSAYEPRSTIEATVANINVKTSSLDRLESIADSDKTAPAIVWLRDGEVVAAQRINANVGLHFDAVLARANNNMAKVRLTMMNQHGNVYPTMKLVAN